MIRKVRVHINKISGLGMQGYIIRCGGRGDHTATTGDRSFMGIL